MYRLERESTFFLWKLSSDSQQIVFTRKPQMFATPAAQRSGVLLSGRLGVEGYAVTISRDREVTACALPTHPAHRRDTSPFDRARIPAQLDLVSAQTRLARKMFGDGPVERSSISHHPSR